MTNTIVRRTILTALSFCLLAATGHSFAQQLTPGQRSEAKRQLQTMSPEEIDAKIASLGMTREEAEKRAKENGIDLQAYLKGVTQNPSTASPTQIFIQSGDKPVVDDRDGGTSPERTAMPKKAVMDSVRGLPFFGYEVFMTVPAAFEPSASGPVDPEYIVGPDDVLRLSVWGQVEQQSELVVDRDGRIFLPTAGPIVVSGLTVEEIQKAIERQLSRSFQGLTSNPKTVWLDVALGRIKPKRVFIMGEVNNPGGYTVNSYATVFSSLFSVGGPTVKGSLRDVRLIRGNKVVAKIDLYQYLTGAEKNNDLRVQNNDIVYVPVRKSTVFIDGEVRRPGIYELLPGENLRKLVEYAGGTMPSTYVDRFQIERILPPKDRVKNEPERRFFDANYRELLSRNSDFTIVDGDFVSLFPVLREVRNYVTISGPVNKPGKFQFQPKMRIRDLILMADSLRPETYIVRAELVRTMQDNMTRVSMPFDLRAAMEGNAAANIFLQPMDEVFIHTKELTQLENEFIDVYGSVKEPGRHRFAKGMTLIDVVLMSKGFTEDAYRLKVEVARMSGSSDSDSLVFLTSGALPDLRDTAAVGSFSFFEEFRKNDFPLKHRDMVFIRPDPAFRPQTTVNITGEVRYPGDYALTNHNEYLSDLIARAGGVTPAAYLRGGRIVRENERVNVDFQEVMDSPRSNEDIILHPNDKVEVPKKPNFIRISGEVNNPGLLAFISSDRLGDYIDRSGGLTDSAEYIILIHPNGYAERFRTGFFGGNSDVYDGSTIMVTKVAPPKEERKEFDIGNLIRDLFAITASALTILVLSRQL